MIKVKEGQNTIILDLFTENPEGIIDEMKDFGYECYYTTNGVWGELIYPNYKEADEIACNWVGAPTMTDFTPNHRYLEKQERR